MRDPKLQGGRSHRNDRSIGVAVICARHGTLPCRGVCHVGDLWSDTLSRFLTAPSPCNAEPPVRRRLLARAVSLVGPLPSAAPGDLDCSIDTFLCSFWTRRSQDGRPNRAIGHVSCVHVDDLVTTRRRGRRPAGPDGSTYRTAHLLAMRSTVLVWLYVRGGGRR